MKKRSMGDRQDFQHLRRSTGHCSHCDPDLLYRRFIPMAIQFHDAQHSPFRRRFQIHHDGQYVQHVDLPYLFMLLLC